MASKLFMNEELIISMEIDPATEVRRLAVQNVPIGDLSVKSVAKRLSDK